MLDKILESFPEEEIIRADGLDEAIMGIEQFTMCLIYSKSKVIDILVREGMTEQDALEHFSYNIQGAYIGDRTPIWCIDDL